MPAHLAVERNQRIYDYLFVPKSLKKMLFNTVFVVVFVFARVKLNVRYNKPKAVYTVYTVYTVYEVSHLTSPGRQNKAAVRDRCEHSPCSHYTCTRCFDIQLCCCLEHYHVGEKYSLQSLVVLTAQPLSVNLCYSELASQHGWSGCSRKDNIVVRLGIWH